MSRLKVIRKKKSKLVKKVLLIFFFLFDTIVDHILNKKKVFPKLQNQTKRTLHIKFLFYKESVKIKFSLPLKELVLEKKKEVEIFLRY